MNRKRSVTKKSIGRRISYIGLHWYRIIGQLLYSFEVYAWLYKNYFIITVKHVSYKLFNYFRVINDIALEIYHKNYIEFTNYGKHFKDYIIMIGLITIKFT